MPGTLLADRYKILEEAPRAVGGRLFRARDVAFACSVAVKELGQVRPAARHELHTALGKVHSHPHPGLLAYHSLHLGEGLLIREWVHGFSLLDLLKRRHKLRADEALHVLDALPAILDFIATAGLPVPERLLAKIFFQFEEHLDADPLAAEPPAEWPAFALRINPLSVRALLRDHDDGTVQTTLTDLRTLLPGQHFSAPRQLAELLHEVLGGHRRSGSSRDWTPLPALREEGNGVLRRALFDDAGTDCRSLWAELQRAEVGTLPPSAPAARSTPPALPPPLRIPSALPAHATPTAALTLRAIDPDVPSIRLSARSAFAVGRSPVQADFLTRFLPETAANETRTAQLSRIHVLAELRDDHLTLRDGNGRASSVNGTALDDRPLSCAEPARLTRRARLLLGDVYPLEVVPLPIVPTPLAIAGQPSAPTELAPFSAVLFLPADGQPLIRHAAWVFSTAGFGLDAAQQLAWDTRGSAHSPAAFHRYGGGFWLANRALPATVLEVAGVPLAPGEIAPLAAGQRLRIGPLRFTIEIS